MNKLILTLILSFSLIAGICPSAYAAPGKVEQAAVMEPVNLNKADLVELQKVSGVGEKKAKAIIQYREANGPFTDIKQLLNVKGIGEKFLMKNAKSLRL